MTSGDDEDGDDHVDDGKVYGAFENGPISFHWRHRSLKGSLLRERFDADYRLQFSFEEHVPLFHDKECTRKVFKRHPDNRKCLEAVKRAYIKFFLETGI